MRKDEPARIAFLHFIIHLFSFIAVVNKTGLQLLDSARPGPRKARDRRP
jgi:hypothetical protein